MTEIKTESGTMNITPIEVFIKTELDSNLSLYDRSIDIVQLVCSLEKKTAIVLTEEELNDVRKSERIKLATWISQREKELRGFSIFQILTYYDAWMGEQIAKYKEELKQKVQ